ncbi:MAG: serine hydrolase domain-containing protein [Planctomycetota bacterium]
MQRLHDVLKAGIAQGLHPGAQVYVSIEGETIAEFAVGTRDGQNPLQTDTPMLWMSAGKPLTAVAIAQLVEAGELDWDDEVHTLVPGFDQGGKRGVKLRHLLTHTAGLEEPPGATQAQDWHDFALAACQTALKAGELPGSSAAYSPHANWAVLGLIIERLTQDDFSTHLTHLVLDPIGGERIWCGVPETVFDELGDAFSVMHDTSRQPGQPERAEPVGWHTKAYATQPRPGANTYATARDLGRFYETMLGSNGTTEGTMGGPLLSAQTVGTMTRRQRQDRFDATFRHVIDFGYGFLLNSWHHGPDTVPYGYGAMASESAFGHSGNQSTVAFADPETQVVVAIACNGMPGEPRHQKRLRAWLQALEEDLAN